MWPTTSKTYLHQLFFQFFYVILQTLNSHLIIIHVYPPQGCLFLFFVSSSLFAWMMYRHFHNHSEELLSESDIFFFFFFFLYIHENKSYMNALNKMKSIDTWT